MATAKSTYYEFCVTTLNIVGLPDTAAQEAKERVRAAIRNSGCEYPMRRITANLAPADLRKAGPSYDLPLAVAVLASSGQIFGVPENSLFLGELSLNGDVRHTAGILPMVAVAQEAGIATAYVPAEDGPESALIDGIEVVPVRNLAELLPHLRDEEQLEPLSTDPATFAPSPVPAESDLANVRGQEHAKRAMEVAAAGGHNLFRLWVNTRRVAVPLCWARFRVRGNPSRPLLVIFVATFLHQAT